MDAGKEGKRSKGGGPLHGPQKYLSRAARCPCLLTSFYRPSFLFFSLNAPMTSVWPLEGRFGTVVQRRRNCRK